MHIQTRDELLQSIINYSKEYLITHDYRPDNISFRKSNSKSSPNKWFLSIGSSDPIYSAPFQKIAEINLSTDNIIRVGHPSSYSIDPPFGVSITFRKPDKYNILSFNSLHLTDIFEYVCYIIQNGVETYIPTNSFGCCEKYSQCSNVGNCIHINKLYGHACQYRINLLKGNCFLK